MNPISLNVDEMYLEFTYQKYLGVKIHFKYLVSVLLWNYVNVYFITCKKFLQRDYFPCLYHMLCEYIVVLMLYYVVCMYACWHERTRAFAWASVVLQSAI